jgi:hypothetical protein
MAHDRQYGGDEDVRCLAICRHALSVWEVGSVPQDLA